MSYIKRIFGNIKDSWSRQKESDPAKSLENNIDNLFFQKALSNEEQKLFEGIKESMLFNGRGLYAAGLEDGKKEVPMAPTEDIAAMYVQFIKDHVKSVFNGKKLRLESEKTLAKQVMEREQKASLSQDGYRDSLIDYFRKYPKQHSWMLFFFYLIIALFLILADVPLALELTKWGFQFESLSDSDNTEIIYLFQNPIQVFIANWEVFLLSFGIALCAIYVKIIYDELVGSPLQSIILKFKNIPGIDYDNPDEIDKLKKEDKFRKRIKIAIFIITVITIIILGFFRFSAIKLNPASADIPQGFTSKLTFILITLLFPLIGGVCFSISLSNLQNILRLNGEKRKSNRLHKIYLKALRNFSNKQEQHQDICGFIEDWNSSTSVDSGYIRYLNACYVHGYNHGQMNVSESHKDDDLYDRTQRLRDSIVSRNIFKAMSQNNKYKSRIHTIELLNESNNQQKIPEHEN